MAVRIYKSLFTLLLVCVGAHCKCKTTYTTRCDKVSDISRYGKQTWQSLILANDECSKDVPEPPNEVLNSRAFSKASNLEELYIVEKLVDIQPGAFDGLNQLTYLKLYKNFIKVIPKEAFANLTQIWKLDLRDNSIENIQHGLFANSMISWIDLSHNKLNNLQVDMVALPSLKKLVITNNDMSQLVPHCFHENLEQLNLDNNNLSEIEAGVLNVLKNLKELILSNNKLKVVTNSYTLPSLQKLDLSHNQIQGIEEGSFSEFFELKFLYLEHNQISYLNSKIFPEESAIEVLHLHRNDLISLDAQVGTYLPSVKEMSIGGNPWACSCLDEIVQYFTQKNIQQTECDRIYFSSGVSAVCWVTSNECTGEKPTQDVASEIQQALEHYQC